MDKLNAAAGKTITISYTATLQIRMQCTTIDGNRNTVAQLEYTNKIGYLMVNLVTA